MTDKEIIIDDQKETIHRLQQECTEKTNAIIALGEQLSRKEQELQVQRNFTTQEQRKIYCVAYDKTCETGNECKQKKCVFKDRLKYKQALDEIERFCKDACDSCKKFTPNRQSDISCRFCQATQILNIINKVKEK